MVVVGGTGVVVGGTGVVVVVDDTGGVSLRYQFTSGSLRHSPIVTANGLIWVSKCNCQIRKAKI